MAQNQIVNSTKKHQIAVHPVGNTGITGQPVSQSTVLDGARIRANIELSPQVSLCLDHVCEVTGATRSQVINSALLDALPGLIDRADGFLKRSRELSQVQGKKK